MAKFSQNEDLKQQLLSTGDSWLVECAGSDKVWACGIRLDDDRRRDIANWTGTNILGFALMGGAGDAEERRDMTKIAED